MVASEASRKNFDIPNNIIKRLIGKKITFVTFGGAMPPGSATGETALGVYCSINYCSHIGINTVLAIFRSDAQHIIECDSSNYACGACLKQIADDDGREQVVAYASKTLSDAQRRYCVTKK
jgi:hypothetical protein